MAGASFCWLDTRSVCNCCSGWAQRWILFIFAGVLFGVGLWQAAQIGQYRQQMFEKKAHGEFNDRNSNAVSQDLVRHAEFAACFTIGAGATFLWHVLKWNVVTRYLTTLLILGSFSVQLVTLGFASQQAQKDKPSKGTDDISPNIVAGGSAGVIACGFSLFNLILIQCLANEYKSGEGQTNCCDNNCCNIDQDCCVTETCCGLNTSCSFGRFFIFASALTYFAVFATRAAVTSSLIDDLLEAGNDRDMGKSASMPKGNYVSLNLTFNIIVVSAVTFGYTIGALFHVIYMWNVTSQAFVLCAGFVAVTFEVYATGYSIKYWDVADYGVQGDQDKRFNTIASLTICALAAIAVNWVASWFFSDNFDSHVDSDNKANCCEMCGKFIAMLILAVLGLISFGLYIARAADGGQMKLDQYDNKKQYSTVATDSLVGIMFMDAGLGLGMSLFVLVHLFFWNTLTGTVLGFGFLTLVGMDMLTLGLGSKQQKFAADRPSSAPDIEKDFVSIASLSIIQPAFSGAIAIVALLFSCDYDDEDADRGTARGSDVGSDATDEETGTYETDLSGTETDASGTSASA